MQTNRKTATKLLLVQWSRFQNVCIRLEGSTLFTGVNGSGKSTILDAMTYLLTGNTQFNKAARDRDRTVAAYVRGDTKSNGPERYLRTGEIVSYIAMEFWSPVDSASMVAGVCIESADDLSYKSSWFVCRGAAMEQLNFTAVEGKTIRFTPKQELAVNGQKLKSADFWGRERGVEQVLRALGLRCDAAKYRLRLLKMMAFNPENNIDQFIKECVLDPGKVDSLGELREQKRQFEHIKDMYESLRAGREQLEEVEQRAAEYEKKLKSLQIREFMLCYQRLRDKEEEQQRKTQQKEALLHRQSALEERRKELDGQYEAAGERCRIAEQNDMARGMQDSIRALEGRIRAADEEIHRYEEKREDLRRLQAQLSELLEGGGELFGLTDDETQLLRRLAEMGAAADKKTEAFLHAAEVFRQQGRIMEKEEVHCEDRMEQLDREMDRLETKIRLLKANRMVFPAGVEQARRILEEEFTRQGLKTDVRIFAELVEEVTRAEWRTAVETFLGRKRFYLIVDGAVCHKAMEILQKKAVHGVNVVLTDKLPDTPVTPGSAAEILKIPNVYARRYANYLLNAIHLCESEEELHEYPKGGLMKNGMLAKGYAVSCMDMSRTDACLGGDSIRLQLKKAEEEKERTQEAHSESRREADEIRRKRARIGSVNWDAGHYDFQAAARLKESAQRKDKLAADLERIRSNPDFLAILQEQQDARQEYDGLKAAVEAAAREIGSCENERQRKEEELAQISAELYILNQDYSEACIRHMELKRPMLEEYESLIKNSRPPAAQKAVRRLEGELKECVRRLEDAQLNYCKLTGTDINRRGAGYIPFYREEYRNIANIRIEEVHNRLREQGEKLENAFMNDFVAEINETVREARAEIEIINRELKKIPFGSDTYRFVMRKKPDRDVFFRICERLEEYMDTPEAYMNLARDDEEMERDIREFMSVILDEEDETQYTDYRNYFVYDMEISSLQGGKEITADLSKKQGSASNGEKQTPYFIILAASLLQYYPRQVCCARLVFIDEAFSALSRERIEQMVKYFEENHFQVFYAAPPEKISSIGAFIESTVSLVASGRYTHAVEGLAGAALA